MRWPSGEPGPPGEASPGVSVGGGIAVDPPSPHETPQGPLSVDRQSALCPLRHRTEATTPDDIVICQPHLEGWGALLGEIAELLGEVGSMLAPSPSAVSHHRGKPVSGNPPLRLDVLVSLDAEARAGDDGVVPLGMLIRHERAMARQRRMQHLADGAAAVHRMRLHLRWVARHGDVAQVDRDIRALASSLRRVSGEPPRRSVGTCSVQLESEEGEVEICGGQLIADRHGELGVTCVSCGDRFSGSELRRLGLLLAESGS